MSLFDALFGNTRRAKPKMDPLFALPVALVDMEAASILPLGIGGLCVRVPEGAAFTAATAEVRQILSLYATEHKLAVRLPSDTLGFSWWIVESPTRALDDVVTSLHMVGEELRQRGYGDALLAAAFPLEETGHGPFVLIYNYRRGLYYPFVPAGGTSRGRDNAREIRLSDGLPANLPREQEIDRWYALWDAPLSRSGPLEEET